MRHVYVVFITTPEFNTMKVYRHLVKARQEYPEWFTDTRVQDMREWTKHEKEWTMFLPNECDWPKVKVQRKLAA